MILNEKLKNYRIILGSSSPRRRELLEGLGLNFEVIVREVHEDFPGGLVREQIPLHLAEQKASAFVPAEFGDKVLIVTADTIVWLEDTLLGKPDNYQLAIEMLKRISGKTHEVFTGVCIKTNTLQYSFFAASKVKFRSLNAEEIIWYVKHFKPYDKAGAYGIQEWIGFVGIEYIEGSFYNVMGLPTQRLYRVLNDLF
ncbi:MAG: Maf family nucleotide pyrophosphatase [Bacteroidales bacterium]|jgi:septum formation protein|nr:Maf family nucleotide pyrophosphatase [Bacteroidales bacterium]MDD4214351.1 Maf family nucleotide pyrophosphatase [Bacteroidales bacterium]